MITAPQELLKEYVKSLFKIFDKRGGKADNKGKTGELRKRCGSIQAISAGKNMT